ncbi:MAG: hypothetical protein LQ346_003862 [Caloplaca aetnensis]|nr:MAG: hypothetical protein LQ346_003862 [Caloplaca aetnensis]
MSDYFHNLVCKGYWLFNAVIKRTTPTGNVWKESDLDAAYFWDDEEPFQPVAEHPARAAGAGDPARQGRGRLCGNQPEYALQDWGRGICEFTKAFNETTYNQAGALVEEKSPTWARMQRTCLRSLLHYLLQPSPQPTAATTTPTSPPARASVIIAQHNYSPKRQFPSTAGQQKEIPQLYRWSDVVWLAWTMVAGGDRDKGPAAVHRPREHRHDGDRGGGWSTSSARGAGTRISCRGPGQLAAPKKKYPAVCIFTAPTAQEDRPEQRNDYYMIWELQDVREYAQVVLDQPRTCRDMI